MCPGVADLGSVVKEDVIAANGFEMASCTQPSLTATYDDGIVCMVVPGDPVGLTVRAWTELIGMSMAFVVLAMTSTSISSSLQR